MPMQWTAENDRLLFLKVLEIQNISVDSERIANAWPRDAPIRPTSRAIKERIVKLRQLAGIKVSIKSNNGTPKSTVNTPRKSAAPRAPKTPKSSGKKRKIDEESDTDDHLTEDETPTKVGTVQRGKSVGSLSIDDRGHINTDQSNGAYLGSKKLKPSFGLRASMDDPFEQKLSKPVFTSPAKSDDIARKEFDDAKDQLIFGSSPANGRHGSHDSRARSARQASQKASDALHEAENDSNSSEDSQVSEFQQSDYEV